MPHKKKQAWKKDVKNKDEHCSVTADLSLQRQFPFQDSQRVQINRHKNSVMDFLRIGIFKLKNIP